MMRQGGLVQQTTAPAVEPVSLDDIRAHLHISGTNEDAILNQYSLSARERVEAWLGRALIQRSFALFLDHWPTGAIWLPKPPLQSIDQIEIRQVDGVTQMIDLDQFDVDARAEPGLLLPKDPSSLPQPYGPRAIRIDFGAGYGTQASDVPAPIRQAILMTIAGIYEGRGGDRVALAPAVLGLLMPYRIMGL